MGNNGELKTAQEKTEEIKPQAQEKGIPAQNLPPKPETPVTDFKIGEIWIRSGQLMLDAPPEFWKDKIRARGVIAYLDDIVKEAKVPDDKPKIMPARGSFLNGLRKFKFGRKR